MRYILKQKLSVWGRYFSFIQQLYADITQCFGTFLVIIHSNLLRTGKISMLTSGEGKQTLWRCWQSTQCWSNMKQSWARVVSIKWCIASSHITVHSEGCLDLLYPAGYCRSPPLFTRFLLAMSILELWKRFWEVLG